MSAKTPHPTQAPAPWAASCMGALLGTLIGVLLFAPAPWLTRIVERASAERVQWHHVGGTVWNGSGQLMLRDGPGATETSTLPGTLHWTLRPRWDGLDLAVSAACCTPSALHLTLRIGWDGIHLAVADGVSQWPAELLSGLGAPWNTVRAHGSLQLHSQQLQLHLARARWRLSGSVQLDALGISSRLSPLAPMGSYRLRLAGGETATVELSTIEGHLELSGSGQWTGNQLRFQGQAQAAAGFEDTLGNLLNIIGKRNGAHSSLSLG